MSDELRGRDPEPLRDESELARLRVDEELETVAWPNGADLAPEYLYFLAFKDVPELQSRFKEVGLPPPGLGPTQRLNGRPPGRRA